MHDHRTAQSSNALTRASAPTEPGTSNGMREEAKTLKPLLIEREVRSVRVEQVVPRLEGTLLVGELEDILLLMPVQDLGAEMDADDFRQALISHAGRKPFIVVELNQQGALPTDAVIYPLIHFAAACEGKSKIYVATRDASARHRFSLMTRDEQWSTVDSGREAIRQIDLDIFLAERKIRLDVQST